jgi:hypothetical protein
MISFGHPVDTSYALRHSYYKLSLSKYLEENNDFLFLVRSARNGCPNGVSLESVNYSNYYIAPKQDGVYIAKDGPLEDQSWIAEGEDYMQLRSLSTNPDWKDSYLAFGPNNTIVLSKVPANNKMCVYEIPTV